MNKPLTLLVQETKSNLVGTINNSSLPPCVLELIIKDIINEIHILSQKQLQEDELAYMNSFTPTENAECEQKEKYEEEML